MKQPCLLACCALLGLSLTACGGDSMPDPGTRTEDAQTVDLESLFITVRGRVDLLPEAARLLADQGQPPPTLGGLPLSIEEPLRVGVNDPAATFGTGTLAEDGGFSVRDVPVKDIHLSLAARFAHEGFVPSSTIVFDTAFSGSRPRTDIIDARAWALPWAFHDALSGAVGEEALRLQTEGRARTLLEAGFLLGRVVDASGQPIAGVRVRMDQGALSDRLYYPSEDLSRVGQEGTSANGLFLYVHSGGDAETFRLSVHGTEAYLWRNAGATPGLGLVLTLYPGTYAP
ncbi:carboxypeptidase regulatory-like domain-containing protein [Hyalangium rubrum]|uniref:Carboxypeptidase regulatory-like domain-containing protein n=1 Tax=Hyalangium rubrum TaxID=3103134 RepID=A0ABU5H263_9BACT|nr:carboxypeptidase regulatory-like domain-containing protein [Hyalangium sp. s54d21]MDY7226195.1 carboxypeptidase regulatory-like domain-containing protein [Hyalangium sp. s54d21]